MLIYNIKLLSTCTIYKPKTNQQIKKNHNKSKKDRQHNGQKKKDKRTNNDLQYITHKIKD